MIVVARVRRRSDIVHSQVYLSDKIWGDKKFLSFISGKREWESPLSILAVPRNPN
jgi:hypothetical protein